MLDLRGSGCFLFLLWLSPLTDKGLVVQKLGAMSETKTIWVNEQRDPAGLLYACIACCDEQQARDCHQSFVDDLTDAQKSAGWVASLRTVTSWDEVPASALKLN